MVSTPARPVQAPAEGVRLDFLLAERHRSVRAHSQVQAGPCVSVSRLPLCFLVLWENARYCFQPANVFHKLFFFCRNIHVLDPNEVEKNNQMVCFEFKLNITRKKNWNKLGVRRIENKPTRFVAGFWHCGEGIWHHTRHVRLRHGVHWSAGQADHGVVSVPVLRVLQERSRRSCCCQCSYEK